MAPGMTIAWQVFARGLRCVVLFVAVSALDARAAGADEPVAPARYTPYVDRGNAVPAPFAYVQPGITATLRAAKPAVMEASLGFAAGLTSRVWVDGSLGTLAMTPGVGYHSFQIGPNAMLVDTPAFELAATTHVSFGAADGRLVEQIEPGLFWVARAAHKLRLDAGLFVDANPGPTATFGLRVPVTFSFQLTTRVFAAVNTGMTVGSFADTRGTTAIPVGVAFGWGDRLALGARPIGVAVLPSIMFPELLKPGAAETFRPGFVAVGLAFIFASRLW
jgi:hypothetical protein